MLPRSIGVCLLLISGSGAYSQSSCSVAGRVVELGSGQPVKDATITLASTDTAGQRSDTRTDAAGLYRFEALPAGRYSISVSKVGYGSSGTRMGRNSNRKVVTLEAGQRLKDLSFVLNRAGVISGRVVDSDGQPVIGARVSALVALNLSTGKWVYPAGRSAQSDDRGEFRVHDLQEGRYYVRATGPSVPIVFERDGGVRQAPGSRFRLLTTFFPGVEDFDQAVPVTVRSGQETPGIDLRLRTGEVFTISGQVSLPAEAADASMPRIKLEAKDRADVDAQSVPCDRAGKFTLSSVRPGVYRVSAYAVSRAGRVFVGSVELVVSDRDSDNVTIALAGGSDIHGVVKVEDGKPLPADVAQRIKVFMMPGQPDPFVPRTAPGTIDQSGRFVVPAVPEGEYWVRLQGLPDQYYPKRIRYGNADVTGRRSFAVMAGGTLEIEVSHKAGGVTATVRDSEGNAFGWAYVVGAREGDASQSRPVRIGFQADQHGAVPMTGIRPGAYRFYAFDTFDDSLLSEFDLSRYDSQSVRVEVNESGRYDIELRVSAFQF